ncbi:MULTISPECIES: peptidoglycan D,D-transpeptidase FtsI family protein [Methylosinus]|uniref:Penicillin-binding protein 2 n=1 Tax=Methylosinus trichosporium (strain ATCC 35070 / NCIMB 11131 / UNIQEM 75 / OB3b) TaxID=595536 RepID=A0A2D2D038_METT3|nr:MULTISPECIES: penicillin-binding protein 2 [Methylosinus]ATQ68383.1 penicillin-binding protein 2 [Methylosinus trichosporium OB3b]OBS51377.1 penicillin-binding protein [Methylosinus sp. 3S-1]
MTTQPTAPKPRLLSALFTTSIAKTGGRMRLVAGGFLCLYLGIGARLVYLGFKPEPPTMRRAAADAVAAARPDVLDRNGEILATDVKTMSVFAEPRRLIDKDEATELLTAVLPNVDPRELRERLGSRKGFVWVKREVTPHQRDEVFHLGLPGVGLLPENKRVYPAGPIAAHVLGYVNIDNAGIAGIEKYIDGQGLADLHGFGFSVTPEDLRPISLSVDIRATHALRDVLARGVEHFKAKAGAAAILDVNTGEVIALASLPDYDPNKPPDMRDQTYINRMNVGVYEMGSTFKALTIAMALDSGKINLNSRLDARGALSFGRFRIHDYHAQNRALTVPEVFTYSSNIGTARMALGQGVERHKAFLRKMGQLSRMRTELPESAEPIVPRNWGELNTMTIAFGHGLAVAPLQAMMAVGALMNGGYLITPTFLKRSEAEAKKDAPQVVKAETSEAMRYLMRLNAEIGTAKKVDVEGYYVGGKTGTAEKVVGKHYSKNRLFTTFMAVAPSDKPKYLFLTIMDEPQGLPETHGYATAAYNSGAVTAQIIERTGPILGLPPRFEAPQQPFPLLAKLGYTRANTPATGGGGH